MRSLSDIIAKVENEYESGAITTDIEKAIAAAYWAGQSKMRGIITEQVAQRLNSLPESRYHNVARAAAEHVCLGVNGINPNYLRGRGDSGHGEAAEILGWDFDL